MRTFRKIQLSIWVGFIQHIYTHDITYGIPQRRFYRGFYDNIRAKNDVEKLKLQNKFINFPMCGMVGRRKYAPTKRQNI